LLRFHGVAFHGDPLVLDLVLLLLYPIRVRRESQSSLAVSTALIMVDIQDLVVGPGFLLVPHLLGGRDLDLLLVPELTLKGPLFQIVAARQLRQVTAPVKLIPARHVPSLLSVL